MSSLGRGTPAGCLWHPLRCASGRRGLRGRAGDASPARRTAPALLLAGLLLAALPVRADLIVPSGATTELNGGTVDLACTDVVVAGTLALGSGALRNVRHLTIQAGGTVAGNSGTIEIGGDWHNSGAFVAGSSHVQFRDLCGSTAGTVSGSTTFAGASFVSTSGKTYVFAPGTTQTITGVLEIAGTGPLPVQFRSGAAGQVANIDLQSGGSQQIQHVGVTDVWATGQWLAPGLTNEGGEGNASRWFGTPQAVLPTAIPATTPASLALMALSIAVFALFALRRREPARAVGRASRPRSDQFRGR